MIGKNKLARMRVRITLVEPVYNLLKHFAKDIETVNEKDFHINWNHMSGLDVEKTQKMLYCLDSTPLSHTASFL